MNRILKEKFKVDINNYEILRKINQGGFGAIYLVRNKFSKEELIAKVSLFGTNGNSRHDQFIKRELGILMRIQHPTIIRLRGFSLTDFRGNESITILMDYLKNGSLASLLDKEQNGMCPIEYDNTKRQIILAGIARGMTILHSKNVIHRDLSTGNILLDENWHPLITDFGLSKFYDPQHSKSQTLTDFGTAIYMAPEVIVSDRYDTKVDVYSFGIIMYEIITGTKAYSDILSKGNVTAFQLKTMILNGHRPVFDVPIKDDLKKLIEKCWSQNPNDRPTFADLYKLLSMSSSNELLTDEEDERFCLDDVDYDEFIEYLEEITETDIDRLSKKLESMEFIYNEKIDSMRNTIAEQAKEIELLNDKLRSQQDEISRLNSSLKEDEHAKTPSTDNFFYANHSLTDTGIFGTLKLKEKNPFDRLFIASQSSKDIYQLINPNSTGIFSTYTRDSDFFIEFILEEPVILNGIKVFAGNGHFPKSFDILVDDVVVKSITEATGLNGKHNIMTIKFSEKKGSRIRFLQTGPSWDDKKSLFFKRFELLSPEAKYSNGVFTTLIEKSENHDPHKAKVLIYSTSFDFNWFHLVDSASIHVTFCTELNSWFQVELTRGLAVITGFRIRKSKLKDYKITASDDENKPDDMWLTLYEVNEETDLGSKCKMYELPQPSPPVRFIRIVLTGLNWIDQYYLQIIHFDVFGSYSGK